jgi:hypothetical protein
MFTKQLSKKYEALRALFFVAFVLFQNSTCAAPDLSWSKKVGASRIHLVQAVSVCMVVQNRDDGVGNVLQN